MSTFVGSGLYIQGIGREKWLEVCLRCGATYSIHSSVYSNCVSYCKISLDNFKVRDINKFENFYFRHFQLNSWDVI